MRDIAHVKMPYDGIVRKPVYPKFIAGKNLVAEIKIKMCKKFVPSFSI